MKAKLLFASAVAVLSLALQPAPSQAAATLATTDQCLTYCEFVLCTYPQTCGPYTNASGQKACGCH